MTTTVPARGRPMHQLPEDARLRSQFISALQHPNILQADPIHRGVAEAFIMQWGSCLDFEQAEKNLRQRGAESDLGIQSKDLTRGIGLARRTLTACRPST